MSIKATQCKKCGARDVAWDQSEKTGKWYLRDVVTNPRGSQFLSTPHFDRCTMQVSSREVEQASIDEHARWTALTAEEKLAELQAQIDK